MRIIDWSSDVCSSDLERTNPRLGEIDRLLFLERAQPLDPAFPPEPRLLEPAIGKRAIDDHRILGDIARAQLPSDAPHRLVVIRKDAAVEAVFAVVCDSDGIGFAFVRDDGDHRPENLLALDSQDRKSTSLN